MGITRFHSFCARSVRLQKSPTFIRSSKLKQVCLHSPLSLPTFQQYVCVSIPLSLSPSSFFFLLNTHRSFVLSTSLTPLRSLQIVSISGISSLSFSVALFNLHTLSLFIAPLHFPFAHRNRSLLSSPQFSKCSHSAPVQGLTLTDEFVNKSS